MEIKEWIKQFSSLIKFYHPEVFLIWEYLKQLKEHRAVLLRFAVRILITIKRENCLLHLLVAT